MRPSRFLPLPVLASCTQHRFIYRDKLAGRDVRVETRMGVVDAIGAPDGQGGVVFQTRNGAIVPKQEILRVIEIRTGTGAGHGFGFGALAGACLGITLGLASGDDSEGLFQFSGGEKAALGALVFGLLGGIVGVPIGAVKGARVIYTYGGVHRAPTPAPGAGRLSFQLDS